MPVLFFYRISRRTKRRQRCLGIERRNALLKRLKLRLPGKHRAEDMFHKNKVTKKDALELIESWYNKGKISYREIKSFLGLFGQKIKKEELAL